MPHFGTIPTSHREALNFTHNLGNPHPRLANKKGPFRRPMDRPGPPTKSGKITDALQSYEEAPRQALIAANDSPFYAPFQPSSARPYPNRGLGCLICGAFPPDTGYRIMARKCGTLSCDRNTKKSAPFLRGDTIYQ